MERLNSLQHPYLLSNEELLKRIWGTVGMKVYTAALRQRRVTMQRLKETLKQRLAIRNYQSSILHYQIDIEWVDAEVFEFMDSVEYTVLREN